jgi:hypothetical protein
VLSPITISSLTVMILKGVVNDPIVSGVSACLSSDLGFSGTYRQHVISA